MNCECRRDLAFQRWGFRRLWNQSGYKQCGYSMGFTHFLNSKKCSNIYLNKVIDGHQSWFFTLSGWWFQTFFLFSMNFHDIWDNHSHWLSYFSRWLKPPTSLSYWSCYVEFSQVIGVPPNHPFFWGRFSIINYPAIGVPSWLWKPSYSSYHLHSCEDCL